MTLELEYYRIPKHIISYDQQDDQDHLVLSLEKRFVKYLSRLVAKMMTPALSFEFICFHLHTSSGMNFPSWLISIHRACRGVIKPGYCVIATKSANLSSF